MSGESSLGSLQNCRQIEKLQILLERILQVEKENQNTDEALEQVQEIINESSKVVENSTSANEMILDAKILHTGTHFVNTNVCTLNTNLTSFNESSYINGLLGYLENTNTRLLNDGKEWACFGPLTCHLFKKSNPLTYMLGTFTLEPPPPKEKTKVERQKKSLGEEKKVLSSVEETETSKKESDIYKQIMKGLVREYKNNKMKPISYFTFIIDPTSYWKTVENIFHFAFLVRDGSVKMGISEGLPFVEPVLENANKSASRTQNSQFCFTLSVSEWKKYVKEFQIQSSSIPHF